MDKRDLIKRVSDNELEDIFAETYDELAPYHDIDSYDFDIETDFSSDETTIVVHITSMAGNPTVEDFAEIAELQSVTVEILGEDVEFRVKEVVVVSNIDYDVVYA